MNDFVTIINEVGVPVAGLLGLGWLLWQLLSKIMGTIEQKIDAIDDSINVKMDNMEQRLMTQLETQHGIIISLIVMITILAISIVTSVGIVGITIIITIAVIIRIIVIMLIIMICIK